MNRLEEIKQRISRCLFHKCPCGEDASYLIARIEKLEEAMKEIAADDWDQEPTTVWRIEIARKALFEENLETTNKGEPT